MKISKELIQRVLERQAEEDKPRVMVKDIFKKVGVTVIPRK